MDWSQHFSSRMSRIRASEIRELLTLLNEPDLISFAGGVPDPKLFPVKEIAEASQKIFSDPARAGASLQYSVSEGYLPLRQWLADCMAKQGLACTADNVMITNGSQQAIDFVGKLFLSPGDTVLTSSPTYLGALQAFNAYEASYDTLPEPGSNRLIESYSAASGQKPKFGYVMPEFQNPTGTSLSLKERNALLDFAEALDMPLVEDNAYECLRYDGEALPSMIVLAAARAGGIDNTKVIYLGTFSKSIVPAMRIGWVVGAKDIIGKLVQIHQASDLHVASFNQMVMHEVAKQHMQAHTAHVREIYKKRRDAMLKALDAYMPEGVAWTKPEGGMFIWMTLPHHIDTAELMKDAVKTERVAFVPGAAFYPDRSGHHTLRLSYSLSDPEMIDKGISALARLIQGKMGKASRREAG